MLASALSILTWIHLLMGVGVALTSNRFVEYTAEPIRRACRVMNPAQPDRVAKILMGQLCFSAAGFAWLAHTGLPRTSRKKLPIDLVLSGSTARTLVCSVAAAALPLSPLRHFLNYFNPIGSYFVERRRLPKPSVQRGWHFLPDGSRNVAKLG